MESDNPQEDSNPPSEQRIANDDPEDAKAKVTPGRTEFKPPVTEDNCRKSCKAKKHWLDYATFAIEILGLLGLAIYAAITYGIYCANQTASEAAKSAAETAAAQLELAERPWVDASVLLDGPFTFSVNGATIPLRIALRNTGHAPALSVGVWPSALIGAKAANVVSYRPEACNGAERMSNLGVALFPNTNFEQPESVTIGKETMENEKASKEFPGSNFGDVILSPTIIVCLAYRPPFKSDSIYHTAYILDLLKIDSTGLASPNFKIGENIDTKHLLLRLHPLTAISAD
jgi:hypothetical protein